MLYYILYLYYFIPIYILFRINISNIRIGMKYSTAVSCTVIHYFDIKCYLYLAVFLKLFCAKPKSLNSVEYYLS